MSLIWSLHLISCLIDKVNGRWPNFDSLLYLQDQLYSCFDCNVHKKFPWVAVLTTHGDLQSSASTGLRLKRHGSWWKWYFAPMTAHGKFLEVPSTQSRLLVAGSILYKIDDALWWQCVTVYSFLHRSKSAGGRSDTTWARKKQHPIQVPKRVILERQV